ncbi:MAG: anthranilate synthase component I family protein, partial [Patescibacteria group bacterium]
MTHFEILRDVSFDDIWNRLSDAERHVCCARGTDSGWETFIAWNPRERYIASRYDSLAALKDFVRGEQEQGRRIFGYLAYDLGYVLHEIEPRARNDPDTTRSAWLRGEKRLGHIHFAEQNSVVTDNDAAINNDLQLPDILFYSFDAYVVCREGGVLIRASNAPALAAFSKSLKNILARNPAERTADAHGTRELASFASRDEYACSFESVKSHIIDGDIYQLNLTHRLEGSTQKSSRELWSALWEKNHADFSAYIEADGFEILSASPERFISVSADRRIGTFPIKGTRPRGANVAEDEKLKDELYGSEKETAELTMITDLLRNDIGKVCEFGSVRVAHPRIVRAFASVWHAYSHITGVCARGIRSIDALLSMFPGGSVTGCPKKRAMEIIDELEPTMRGVYAGSIGWIDPDDSADFNIAIRTLIKKGERVYLQVGGGIVYDSVEKDEYQETL